MHIFSKSFKIFQKMKGMVSTTKKDNFGIGIHTPHKVWVSLFLFKEYVKRKVRKGSYLLLPIIIGDLLYFRSKLFQLYTKRCGFVNRIKKKYMPLIFIIDLYSNSMRNCQFSFLILLWPTADSDLQNDFRPVMLCPKESK